MKIFLGLITPLTAYLVITLLHMIIPARRTRGYVNCLQTSIYRQVFPC